MAIRQRGLLLLLAFGALFAIFVYWVANPSSYPFDYYPTGPGGAILIAAPGVAAVIGLIEIITGQPFYKMEEAWVSLSRWKRAIGSVLIILIGGAIFFTVIALLI